MSTLSVTTVNTKDGLTDLSISTGNTSNIPIVIYSANGLMQTGNANVNSNAFRAISNNNVASFGISTSGTGVTGQSTSGVGVQAQSQSSTPLVAGNNTTTFFRIESTGAANLVSNTFNLGTSVVAANGYTRLPNGLLMQWGTQSASVNNAASATATFPVAFTTVYSITPVVSAPAVSGVLVSSNTTAFLWRNTSAAASAANTMTYMAIGI